MTVRLETEMDGFRMVKVALLTMVCAMTASCGEAPNTEYDGPEVRIAPEDVMDNDEFELDTLEQGLEQYRNGFLYCSEYYHSYTDSMGIYYADHTPFGSFVQWMRPSYYFGTWFYSYWTGPLRSYTPGFLKTTGIRTDFTLYRRPVALDFHLAYLRPGSPPVTLQLEVRRAQAAVTEEDGGDWHLHPGTIVVDEIGHHTVRVAYTNGSAWTDYATNTFHTPYVNWLYELRWRVSFQNPNHVDGYILFTMGTILEWCRTIYL